MLITKNDIKELVKFSININDNDIDPYIKKAERFLPRIKDDVYLKIRQLPAITYEDYQPNTLIGLSQYREYQGQLFVSLEESPMAPIAPYVGWLLDQYQTIFHLALKPYLVFKAYDYMLIDHGIKVTPAGLTQTVDSGNYEHITDKRRAEFLGSHRADLLYYEQELHRLLKLYGFTDEPDTCGSTNNRDVVGVYVVGRKRRKSGCCDRNTYRPPYNDPNTGTFDGSFTQAYD